MVSVTVIICEVSAKSAGAPATVAKAMKIVYMNSWPAISFWTMFWFLMSLAIWFRRSVIPPPYCMLSMIILIVCCSCRDL